MFAYCMLSLYCMSHLSYLSGNGDLFVIAYWSIKVYYCASMPKLNFALVICAFCEWWRDFKLWIEVLFRILYQCHDDRSNICYYFLPVKLHHCWVFIFVWLGKLQRNATVHGNRITLVFTESLKAFCPWQFARMIAN